MVFNSIRNYLHERNTRLQYERTHFQKCFSLPQHLTTWYSTKHHVNIFNQLRNPIKERDQHRMLQSVYDQMKESLLQRNSLHKEPFEYYTQDITDAHHTKWTSSPGILKLPILYHKGRIITSSETFPETGFRVHRLLRHLIQHKYPQYLYIIDKYCRPLGTSISTFNDFNRHQIKTNSVSTTRKHQIIELIKYHLHATPYLPIHYVDTLYAGMPLHTGTGYHNRHSYKIQAHAKFSRPPEYKDRPTSKGYFFNASHEINRTLVHYIKYNGIPFYYSIQPPFNKTETQSIGKRLSHFLKCYPTIMFTRNHISERSGILKQRPVYAVDELFLTLECMLTFPLHLQARKETSAIMYSYETIRGGCRRIDQIAQNYKTYLCIDWSSFDQSVPYFISDTFFTDFLPQLLIVDHAYHPTFEYPTHPGMSQQKMYRILNNLLEFIHLWFTNMIFITPTGYAYTRLHAGIPSGMLNTQYIDSYANLFIICDAMLEFGFNPNEIKQMKFLIMGDDNCCLSNISLTHMTQFFEFLEDYAVKRFNMHINMSKSILTSHRGKIELLSYECNFGRPSKNIEKLAAQLLYPERGCKKEYMSSRAVGIAYAACGKDRTFHDFCHDVFNTYLPYAEKITPEKIEQLKRYLPGPFQAMDELPPFLLELSFPDLYTVNEILSTWSGELPFSPKWNEAHFSNPPDYIPHFYTTLAQAREKHKYIPPNRIYLPPQ